jgi:hypothetical protein
MTQPDPRQQVEITRVDKRGDWHTVEGVVKGKKVQAHIPAPSLEGRPRKDAEALIRRSLFGVSRMEDSGAQ